MNNISLNPKFITLDFEQAAILAVKLIFPNVIIKGCHFHFYKCIYAKLQDLGFQPAFINKKSSDINEINIRNLYKKKVCALAIMLPREIGKLWVIIMDEYQDIENIEGFYDYLTNTWIDDDALFDSVLWNYYDFKSLRTNSHVKGWHHRLNNVVYPHFYLFIPAIQNDYAYNSAISSRHLATSILTPWKKLCVNRNTRLHNLEERLQQQTLILDKYLEKFMRLIGIIKC